MKDVDFGEPLEMAEPNGAINWCSKGKCTTVRNQGSCGSCWAFAATEVLESAHAIKHGSSPKYLSPQQLVDCSKNDGGCDGGSPHSAFAYFSQHKAAYDSDYPYTGKDGRCKSVTGQYGDSGSDKISGKTASMKSAVEQRPVTVNVQADSVFRHYKGGIITEKMGCGTSTNHVIAAVGWGNSNGQDYFICRNSWGKSYGESGFVKIAASSSSAGVCGINKYVFSVRSD